MSCFPNKTLKKLYQVEFPTREDWETNSLTWKNGSLLWYTDGSKMGPNVGCGIHGVRPRLSYKLNMGRHSSIFQAEVYAIITCADLNLKRGYVDKHIYINSDSQAALHALASVTQTSWIVENCVNILNTLGESNTVVLRWVPGHSDIEDNESADELAKTAARETFIGPEPFIGIACSLAKLTLLNESTHLSPEVWLLNKSLVHSKALISAYSAKHCREALSLDTNGIRMLTRALTGHYGLNKHMSNIGQRENKECRFCHTEDETPVHLLTQCCPLMGVRSSVLRRHMPQLEDIKSVGARKVRFSLLSALALHCN
ncbi:uncharacterized protein LOC113240672 [Hyposmocoma kahamanoa]|uniref:uncharacterized protein LOC113240672 n=1 Tax=Hyposmocoma kahamanoa TaxID=1477025 RepID=UPI000E6D693E|nr:uncharacterized protein LOC113240672 [Hyposmocoma kahamanoa]XP_026333824.1 uncharacterized protein LOC113240672 [Hyposmocoma kahamanoa]XP_026333825.1 uncharacterized protein LOC113240672 [Hyposmocoma kahamanoa]XP_026333826.1 uncharacterized protein LOC113240672 [Hyposmocoma kahamanoa]